MTKMHTTRLSDWKVAVQHSATHQLNAISIVPQALYPRNMKSILWCDFLPQQMQAVANLVDNVYLKYETA